jgi:hypothetical protein
MESLPLHTITAKKYKQKRTISCIDLNNIIHYITIAIKAFCALSLSNLIKKQRISENPLLFFNKRSPDKA